MSARIRTPLVIEFVQDTVGFGAGLPTTTFVCTMNGAVVDALLLLRATDGGVGGNCTLNKAATPIVTGGLSTNGPINGLVRAANLNTIANAAFIIGDVLSTVNSAGAATSTTVWVTVLPGGSNNPSTMALNAQ